MNCFRFAVCIIAITFLPAYWVFVPGLRIGILSTIHWIGQPNIRGALAMLAAIIMLIARNSIRLQRNAPRRS